PGRELSYQTIGLIGCEHIGKDLALILRYLGCKVLVHDILDQSEFYEKHGLVAASLDELLQQSDVVSLHIPYNESTGGIISAEKLALMKENSILINTARGGLVDEQALKNSLKAGKLHAAAMDVFETEPPEDMELLNLPNFMATTHMGGSAEQAILAMGRAAIKGLRDNQIPEVGVFPL
ncbi:MAG: NAD(P)-dependent oxidoreductase, partial [Alphaproteobacteria bacterium]|nr:NAD(P)-dependent oxidoreductase [Alphaproteobacteria bacterium]